MGPDPIGKVIWNLHIPPKAKIFLWQALSDILPHGVNLRKKGIEGVGQCVWCGVLENNLHVLRDCPWAQKVWQLAPGILLNSDTNVPSVSSDLDLANNLQVQDSVFDLSSTPIVHEGRNQVKDAFQRLKMTSRHYVGNKEAKTTTRNNSIHLEMGTVSRTQVTGLSDDQQTLLSLLSASLVHLDPKQTWVDILAHRPSHQGSRISLTVHEES